MVDAIKDEMSLKEGADQFVETLQKTFTETTSSGDIMKVLGDLDDNTMIFAIFHCIEASSDKINIAYVINTLTTDLPREDTRLHIEAVKDFAHEDLTEEMIGRLTKGSEAELEKLTQTWPKRKSPVVIDGPSITFKCEIEEGDMLVTIISCNRLPDLDNWQNLTDAYVIAKVGSRKERTKAVGGTLDPKFDKETSTFRFKNIAEVALQSRLRLQVKDKDTFSSDDLVGKASIKLSKVDPDQPIIFTLPLVTPRDEERKLTESQITAIMNLFSVLDRNNTGYIPPETIDLVAENHTKRAVLLTELKAFIDEKNDINGDGQVSFGEFLEAFRVHEDPGNAEDINMLTEEFKILSAQD